MKGSRERKEDVTLHDELGTFGWASGGLPVSDTYGESAFNLYVVELEPAAQDGSTLVSCPWMGSVPRCAARRRVHVQSDRLPICQRSTGHMDGPNAAGRWLCPLEKYARAP